MSVSRERFRRIVVVLEENEWLDDDLKEVFAEIGANNLQLLGESEGLEDDATVYLLTIPGLGLRLATIGELRNLKGETFLISKKAYQFADLWSAPGVSTATAKHRRATKTTRCG